MKVEKQEPIIDGLNLIPGNEAVGISCNIIDNPYMRNSKLECVSKGLRIFDLGEAADGQEWEQHSTGKTYMIPPGLETPGAGNTQIQVNVSSSRSEFAESFKTETNVNVKYMGFKGQLNASYGQSFDGTNEKNYAYICQNNVNWTIRLNTVKAKFTNNFKRAIDNLPKTFDPKNPTAFFNFFKKWGTHYVSEAEVGGKLYYFTSIEKSKSTSKKDLKVSIEAEYKGLVASTKVDSENEWKKVNSNWSSKRSSRLEVLGTTLSSSIVSAFLNPSEGEWSQSVIDGLANWQENLNNDPRTVGTKFAPIYNAIGDPGLSLAIRKAMDAWSTYSIVLQTDGQINLYPNAPLPADPALLVNGKNVPLSHDPNVKSGVIFAVLDRSSLKARHAKIYAPPIHKPWDMMFLDEMRADAVTHCVGEFIVVLASFGKDAWHMYPAYGDTSFYATMLSWGASNTLYKWKEHGPSSEPKWSTPSGTPRHWGYFLIGANELGKEHGVEDYIYYSSPRIGRLSTDALGVTCYLSPSQTEQDDIIYTPKLY